MRRRLEGFASDRVPESMVGQTQRFAGDDLGIAGRYKLGAGVVYGELMTNVSDESDGTELRLGYRYEGWWSDSSRFRWRPYATLAWRDAKLNNYYYGVPGYEPGAGVNLELGALASLSPEPRAGKCSAASASRNGRAACATARWWRIGLQPEACLGLLYTFKPRPAERVGPQAADRAPGLRAVDRLRPDADPRRLHRRQHAGRHQHRPARRRPDPGAAAQQLAARPRRLHRLRASTRSAACRKTSGRSTATSRPITTSAPGGAIRCARASASASASPTRAASRSASSATRRCAGATPRSCCSTWIRRSTSTSATSSRRKSCARPTSASASHTARACSAPRACSTASTAARTTSTSSSRPASSPAPNSRRPPGSRCR